MALQNRSAIDLIGDVNGRLLAPEATNIDGQVVPWIFGRQWVKPVPLLVLRVTGAYGTNEWSPWPTIGPQSFYFDKSGQPNVNLTDTVSVIWGLGQAGLTIRAVKIDGKIVGIKKNSSGSWVSAGNDTDLEWALVQAFGSFVPHRVSNASTSPWDLSYSPIEVLSGTGAGGIWGRKITAAAVRSSLQALPPTPKPTWSNLTGGSYPAWAHLVGTDAEGLGYAQLTTIRTVGQPRYSGKLPTNIELLVDSSEGPDMRADLAIRRLIVQGLGIPDEKVITDVGPDNEESSSFEAWCAASPQLAVNAQVAGRPGGLLEDLLRVTAGEMIPTADGGVKVLPLGDQPKGDYTPATSAYVIADPAGDIVEIEKRPLNECPNQIVVRYTDPAKPEKQHQMTCRDEEDIRRTGCRPGDDISSDWISTAEHARWFGDWTIRRLLRNRRTLRFEADPRYMALEQGDLVSVHDAKLGDLVFRLKTKDLDPDSWRLSFEAEEWMGESEPVPVIPDPPLYDLDQAPGIPAIDLRADAVETAVVVAQTTADAAQDAADAAQSTADGAQTTASAASIAAQEALDALPGKAATDFSNVGDGSVGARLIAADSAIFRKIVVGELTNICTNPSGEYGISGWAGLDGYDSNGWPGGGSALYSHSHYDTLFGNRFPVVAGEQYWVSFDAYPDVGGNAPDQNLVIGLA